MRERNHGGLSLTVLKITKAWTMLSTDQQIAVGKVLAAIKRFRLINHAGSAIVAETGQC